MKPELAELYQTKAKFESLINQGLDLQEHLRRPEAMPLTPARQSISDVLNYRLMNALFRDYFALNRQILAESPELARLIGIKTIDLETTRLQHRGTNVSLEQVIGALLGSNSRRVLVHLYWTQKLGVDSIAELTGINHTTLAKIIRQYHIITRTQATGVRSINENPVKRAIMSAKIHAGDSDQARSQSMQQFHRDHPEVGRINIERASQVQQQQYQAYILQLFGDNPAAELNRLIYQDQLTLPQVVAAVNAGLTPSVQKLTLGRLNIFLKKYQISANPELTAMPKDHFDLIRRANTLGLLDQLSNREQAILTARYLTHPPKTLLKLAEELSLTRQRVQQVESKAIQKLEDYLSGNSVVLKAAPDKRGRPRKNPPANQAL